MADKDLTWEDLDKMTEQELRQLMDDIKIALYIKGDKTGWVPNNASKTPLDWVMP